MPTGDQRLETCPLGALLLSWASPSRFEARAPTAASQGDGLQLTPGPSSHTGLQDGNRLRWPCLGWTHSCSPALPPLLSAPFRPARFSPYHRWLLPAPHPCPTPSEHLPWALGLRAGAAMTQQGLGEGWLLCAGTQRCGLRTGQGQGRGPGAGRFPGKPEPATRLLLGSRGPRSSLLLAEGSSAKGPAGVSWLRGGLVPAGSPSPPKSLGGSVQAGALGACPAVSQRCRACWERALVTPASPGPTSNPSASPVCHWFSWS